VQGIVRSLIGERFEYAESDGNLFYCESSWHLDIYGAQLTRRHIKLSFYLDRLDADSGAIRMIPGSHHEGTFARNLRKRFFEHTPAMELYGVEERDLPSWTIANEPGDVVVWNYRTIHASYNGAARRRLFSISFREPEDAA
jgi:ectoine hydroxylase-related dioxygenase (phytanoyl-CoA dioxygenase family)